MVTLPFLPAVAVWHAAAESGACRSEQLQETPDQLSLQGSDVATPVDKLILVAADQVFEGQ